MDKIDLCKAIDGIDDELLDRSERANRKSVSLKRRIIAVVAAACLVFVLMGAAAINHWDDIQKWVAYRWEEATGTELSGYQLEAVERLSQDIGVSQTVNGVTVTVDSAALFGNELQLMLRVDGLELPKEGRADIGYSEVYFNSEWCGLLGFGEFGMDGETLIIPCFANGNININEPYVDVEITIDNFTSFNTGNVIGEGKWEFAFTMKNEAVNIIELPDTDLMAYYEIFPEIVEDLPLKIGESQSIDGITVTVESAKVMTDSFELLVRVDGEEIPDGGKVSTYGDNILLTADPAQCAEFEAVQAGGASEGVTQWYRFEGYTKGYDYSEPLNLTLNMWDFLAHEGSRELIAAGEWNINFALMPDEICEKQPTNGEMPITITNVQLSSTGLEFEFEYEHGGVWNEQAERMTGMKNVFITAYGEREIYVVMKDGTEVRESGAKQDWTAQEVTNPVSHVVCRATWPAPIDIEEVAEVHIGDTVIPVG